MRQGAVRPELALSIADPDGPQPPPVLRPPDPAVDVWRDTAGEVCAYTYPVDGQFCMDWPAVARFCFDPSGATIRAWANLGQSRPSVERVHRRAVVPASLQHLGFETLHASAASFPSGVIGFVGAAGAGKSTFARACASAGAEHWADDTLVIRVAGGSVRAVAIPFDVALRTPSEQHFQTRSDNAIMRASADECALRALILLDRGATDLAIAAVPAGEALRCLLPHACAFTMRDDARRRVMIEQYLKIVSEVPVYRLSYPSDYGALTDVVERVGREMGRRTKEQEG